MNSAGGLKLVGEPDGLTDVGDDAGRIRTVLLHLFDEVGGKDPAVGVDFGVAAPFGIGVELEHLDFFVLVFVVASRFLFETEFLFGFGFIGIGLRVEEIGEDLREWAELDGSQVGEEDADLVVRADSHEAEPFVLVFDDRDRFAVFGPGSLHHLDKTVEVGRIPHIDIERTKPIAGFGKDLSEVGHASIVTLRATFHHSSTREDEKFRTISHMRLHVADHPLIAHKLSVLRDQNTDSARFRQLTEELVMLLAYEATRSVAIEEKEITTPVTTFTGTRLAEPRPVVVPILRAGLGMLDGMLRILPTAEVGFLGMVRDEETFEPSAYADRLPDDLSGRQIFVVDPMLATGGTLAMAIDFLLARGARDVTAVCLVSAPEGVERIEKDYAQSANVEIYTAALDEKLNEKGYIVPGLGDAGDRMYGIVD